jgi:hypothetical protein
MGTLLKAANPSPQRRLSQRYQTPHAPDRRRDLAGIQSEPAGFKVNPLQRGFTLTSYCVAAAMHP